jgi:hypothetical protein
MAPPAAAPPAAPPRAAPAPRDSREHAARAPAREREHASASPPRERDRAPAGPGSRGPGASAQTALVAAVSLLFGGLWAAVLLAPTSFVLPQLRRRLVPAAPHRAPRPLAARLERPG